jgi:hypothetical protein
MKPLPVPSDVPTAPAAVEVLRAWVDGRYTQWAVLPTAFDAPKGWGVLLADAAHQIADVIAAAQGVDPKQVLQEIEAAFFAEIEEPTEAHSTEQAVLVYLDGRSLPAEVYQEYDVGGLEDQLRPLLEQTGVGDYDGDEFGPEEVTLFMYGPDAEALFRVIEPALLAYPLCQNARVIIRPGGPRTRGREIRLPRL